METRAVWMTFLLIISKSCGKYVDIEPRWLNDDDNSIKNDRLEETCEESHQTKHETKCHLYYRCVYGRKILKECLKGMLFNPDISNCDSSYNVACGTLETEDEPDKYYGDFSDYYSIGDITPVDKDRTKTTTPSSECPEKQDPYEPNPLIRHEEKCNAFYKCFEGQKYPMKCPGVLQFNPRVSACDWPIVVKCVDKKSSTSSPATSTVKNTGLTEKSTKKCEKPEGSTNKSESTEESTTSESTKKLESTEESTPKSDDDDGSSKESVKTVPPKEETTGSSKESEFDELEDDAEDFEEGNFNGINLI